MVPKLPGSGNHIVDLYEEMQEVPDRLECGCYRACRCDSGWDERED